MTGKPFSRQPYKNDLRSATAGRISPPLSAPVLGRRLCHLPIFLPMHFCILSAALLVRQPPLSSCASPCVFKYKIIDDECPRQECILAEDRESLEQAHPSREPKSLHTAGQGAQITDLCSGSMAGFL